MGLYEFGREMRGKNRQGLAVVVILGMLFVISVAPFLVVVWVAVTQK